MYRPGKVSLLLHEGTSVEAVGGARAESATRSTPVPAVMKCILCTCLKTIMKETLSSVHFIITGHWHFLNDSDKIILPEKKKLCWSKFETMVVVMVEF